MYYFLRVFFLICTFMFGAAYAATENTAEPPLSPEFQHALSQNPEPLNNPSTGELYLEFFKMIFMLGVIIAFLLLIMWFIKRMLSSRIEQLNTTSVIKILERRPITPKTALYIVEAFDKRLMIAESHNGVTLLSDLTAMDNNPFTDPKSK